MPLESTGYIDLRVSPGSITHLREDEFWRSRTVVSLGSTGHLE
jgi:probable phosphoglycerate mutase